ncbi:MAG: CHASE2 domain-containing protein, partial [Calditrichae bacterium]|nr:CHASE2 domain-containing protein [Calditrichia bacterium]NIW79769.1 CHASE2 domain-containing protein [Calditrichia bacterium]
MRRIFIGGITGVVAVLIVWILANVVFESFFYRFEASTYDYRVRKIIEPPSHLIEDVVIVDIDNRSLNELGALNQWPRTYWAKALEILQRGGARMVAFDIIFDHSRRFPEEDQQFIQQIADHGNVISSISLEVADPDRFLNPMSEEPEGLNWEKFSIEVPDNLAFRLFTFDRMEPHFPQLHNASAQIGAVNFSLDVDGISRRLPLFLRFNEHVYPTLAAAMALQKLDAQNILYDEETQEIQIQSQNGQTISVPVDEKGRALIYFHGPFQTFRYIPFSSLLKEEVPVDYFNDKVVLFGSSAPGLYDLRSIPWQPTFPGVEIHANFFHQIVNQRFIEEMTAGNEFLYILIVGVICGVLFTLFRPRGGIITSIVMAILIFTVAWVAFSAQLLWLPLLTPFLTVLLTFTIHYTYRYTVEEHDKRAIK